MCARIRPGSLAEKLYAKAKTLEVKFGQACELLKESKRQREALQAQNTKLEAMLSGHFHGEET